MFPKISASCIDTLLALVLKDCLSVSISSLLFCISLIGLCFYNIENRDRTILGITVIPGPPLPGGPGGFSIIQEVIALCMIFVLSTLQNNTVSVVL